MKYEAKVYNVDSVKTNETSKIFGVTIISHPVGDTYKFDRSDTTTITVEGFGAKTGDAIEAEIQAGVVAFVKETYPDTK